MKKFLLIFFLFSSNLFSQDLVCIQDDQEIDSFCIYKNTIKKSKNKVVYWGVRSFEKPQPLNNLEYLSTMMKVEVDCDLMRMRFLVMKNHKSPMGKGKVIYQTQDGFEGDWLDPVPNNQFFILNKTLCK